MTSRAMNCVLCNNGPIYEGESRVAKVNTMKGRDTINRASSIRNIPHVFVETGAFIHEDCRAKHINKKSLELILKGEAITPLIQTRSSSMSSFDFKTNCIFCGKYIVIDPKHPKNPKLDESFSCVRTLDFDKRIEKNIISRGDEWASEVKSRICLAVADLHASDVIYHRICYTNFKTGKEKPQLYSDETSIKKRKSGRPIETKKYKAFLKVIEYLQNNDDENFTVADLVSMMKQYMSEEEEPYDNKTMKNKLTQEFGDEIVICSLESKSDVVTFRSTVVKILENYHKKASNLNKEDEALLIIQTAASLIRNDRCRQYSSYFYPSSTCLSDLHSHEVLGFVPQSLQNLLVNIFSGKNNDLKVTAIGQAIMQASRPRSMIAPLQIDLAMQLHHHFSSNFLIHTLFQLGFCKSCGEVQNFQKGAAVDKQDSLLDIDSRNGEFLQ